MSCPCEKNQCSGSNPNQVLQLVKECDPALFHKVERPANLGDETVTPPNTLPYKNVLLTYLANNHSYLYSSDGIPTFISMGDTDTAALEAAIEELQQDIGLETSERVEADAAINEELEKVEAKASANAQAIATETTNREQADTNLQDQINSLSESVETQLDSLDASLQSLDEEVEQLSGTSVQTDTAVSGDASTVTITKTTGLLRDPTKTETALPLPVASEEQAGVMNPATFNAVQENSENIDSILNGAVAVENIRSDVTQAQLTIVWQQNTGKTELINRASIYDITNKKVWTYYENKQEWLDMPAGEVDVTVSQATNESLGIVKGSTEDGQVAVEADGTMSLNGYDGLSHDVDNLAELVAGIDVPKMPPAILGYSTLTRAPLQLRVGGVSNGLQKGHLFLNMTTYNGATGTIYSTWTPEIPEATTVANGVMSFTDKAKLDNLLDIQSLGDGLSLSEDGVLSATGGGSNVNLLEYTLSAPNLNQLWYPVTTEDSIVIRGNVVQQSEEDGANVALSTLAAATTLKAGVMTAADKTKLNNLPAITSIGSNLELTDDGVLNATGGGAQLTDAQVTKVQNLGYATLMSMDGVTQYTDKVEIDFERQNLVAGGATLQTATIAAATNEEAGVMLATDKAKLDAIPELTEMQWTRTGNLPPAVVTGFEDTTYGTDTITMHLDTKDLATGGVSVQELMLEGATANTDEAGGHAGLMTAFQATQLAALAEASASYVTEEQMNAAISTAVGDINTALTTLISGTGAN